MNWPKKSRPHLCVDTRMLHASGIGTVLKSVLPTIKKKVRVTELELKSPIYSIQEQLELPLKIPRCDLFWSPHFNIPLLPIKAKKRWVTIHDVAPFAFYHTLSLPQKLYASLFFRQACHRSDVISTISQFSEREIHKYCRTTKKIIPILNAVSSQFFQPSQGEEYILYVGNIKPHKNLYRLVQAYEKLKPSYPLVLLGKQEGLRTKEERLSRLIEASPFLKKQVRFTGYIEDTEVPKLYAKAVMLVFPSLYEGFGLPPIEAMASHCPVVASNIASIPEVCHDAAEYVDPLSVDDIARGIDAVVSDQNWRNELIKRGAQLALNYTVEKAANHYVELIYESCNCP